MTQLSFQSVKTTCAALGKFAEARSQEKPNKDVVLTVKKIAGKETLQATKLSKMPWYSRLVRWFGFGPATLSSVAEFLQCNEPYLPTKFYELRGRYVELLKIHYLQEDVSAVSSMEKAKYKELKAQKLKGYEIFQQCLSHYNDKRILPCKLSVILQEYGRKDLTTLYASRFKRQPLTCSPQPMGSPKSEKAEAMKKRFYRKPIDEEALKKIPKRVLGFCYEYGIGIEKDLEKARESYLKAIETAYQQQHEMSCEYDYSPYYNLGCLLLKEGKAQEALGYLRQAESILSRWNEAYEANEASTRDLQKIRSTIDQANLLTSISLD